MCRRLRTEVPSAVGFAPESPTRVPGHVGFRGSKATSLLRRPRGPVHLVRPSEGEGRPLGAERLLRACRALPGAGAQEHRRGSGMMAIAVLPSCGRCGQPVEWSGTLESLWSEGRRP
jgi:hypothetical protein